MNTSNVQNGDPNGNIKDVAHTDYTATMSQNITNIPNATYTLTAWVKSSGGQNSAAIAVKNFGGHDLTNSIAKPLDAWTRIVIPGIQVTSGSCTVAIQSDAHANNWVQVDDLSLINSKTGTP
jgi:hypothetical protein